MEEPNFTEMMGRREKILQRLNQRRQMMDLLSQSNIKDYTSPEELLKRNEMAKKIQKKWRAAIKKRTVVKSQGNDIYHILRLQRCVRRYLAAKAKENFRKINSMQTISSLLAKIDPEKVKERKLKIIKEIQTEERRSKKSLDEAEDLYFAKAKEFNFGFPALIEGKIESCTQLEMCNKLESYLKTNLTLDNYHPFMDFKLNHNKKLAAKIKVEKILESMRFKFSSHLHDIEDYETTNLVNEIDGLCGWKKVEY